MDQKFSIRIVLWLFLAISIGAIGFYFYTSYEPSVNHLIDGVPYYGVYNLYPDFTSSAISVATILRYYNDERVPFNELKNEGYTINCKSSIIDDSVFTPPSDVKFFDPTEMMKQVTTGDNGQIDMKKLEELQKQYGGE